MSKVRLMLGGLKSFLPRRRSYSMSSHVVDARYGYSVWLRHLVSLADCGVNGPFSTVVELGPGNSVATGICAVLSGADRYIGLDVLRHLALDGERALEQLHAMFRDAAPVPGDSAFPALRPKLRNYEFPPWLLRVAVDEDKIDVLRHELQALAAGEDGGSMLRYIVPWHATTLPSESVDLVVSQAVLQEIPHENSYSALRTAIAATSRWLRVGGIGSHEIDFGLYGLTPWNVHWSWSERVWTIVRGRRDNFVNREPLSTYISAFRDCGLSVIAMHTENEKGVEDSALAPRFRSLPEAERRTRTAHIVVRKEK